MRVRTSYQSIPRVFDGCIYAVELKNGVIKVGFSRNPRTRMETLNCTVKRLYGTAIARWHISANMSYRAALGAEKLLIARMHRIATPFRKRAEFFHGAQFGAAVTLINQVTRSA